MEPVNFPCSCKKCVLIFAKKIYELLTRKTIISGVFGHVLRFVVEDNSKDKKHTEPLFPLVSRMRQESMSQIATPKGQFLFLVAA